MAAGMSDPNHNPAFRRRWDEPSDRKHPAVAIPLQTARDPIGQIGLALLEAWHRDKTPRKGAGS